MKKCTICKELKDKESFYKNDRASDGLTYQCKKCCIKKTQNRRTLLLSLKEVKEKINITDSVDYKKNYYIKNRTKILEYNKNYYIKNKEELLYKNEIYRQKNKSKINKKTSENYLKTKKNCNLTMIKVRTRNLIRESIKGKGYTKRSKTYDILGCSFEFFKEYIESQFQKGMNWNNIHLDHIKPLKSAKTEEVIELNHYTNFQPLFPMDNLKKHDKLITKQLKLL